MTSALSEPTYRRLFAAQVVALLGTGLLTVALSLLAFDVAPTRAGEVLATAFTVKMVAYVAVAPLVTAVTSRWNPRAVMVGADAVRFAVALALPWVDQAWHVYVLIAVLQSASATFTPTFQAVIPVVLTSERQYTHGLSLSRLAYDLEAVLSPMIAAGLLLVMSYHGLFVGTASGFVLSAVLVLRSGLSAPGAPSGALFWSRATAGVAMFRSRRSLRTLFLLDLAAACAVATVLVGTVVVVREDLGRGPASVAVALAAFGAGSMVVALMTPRWLEHHTDLTSMLVGGGLCALLLIVAVPVVGDRGSWPVLLVVWCALGAASSMVLTPSGRIVNAAVSVAERPAAFAAHFSLSHACYLVAYPVAGWLGGLTSVAAATGVLGAAAALATGAAIVIRPR
ncbi:transporter, major facilitator family protein [Aeromicrobium marinum DSM 15272]|uniref:Transporter, major facilitator family protein n=1 Tax=Aeromicrobium marinum DSM 15272 TaxID=585531 RepID=E2SFP9_9ACTN|nr:transporter, major facilitator family protein [Aeromicrobium marinum DSM 15272]